MKPAHCLNAAGPNFATFSNSFLSLNSPFSSLYATIFLLTALLIPATYCNKDGVAVFKSTPTELTASSTTAVKLSDNFF